MLTRRSNWIVINSSQYFITYAWIWQIHIVGNLIFYKVYVGGNPLQFLSKKSTNRHIFKRGDHVLFGLIYSVNNEWVVHSGKIISRAVIHDIAPYKTVWSDTNKLRFRTDWLREEGGHILKSRSKIFHDLRNFMHSLDFVEVQTPFLIGGGTDEGAGEFIVPSRVYPTEWYRLPQSPQIFKQMLMYGHIERYFQIATCFRDEDPRSDRLYGEFTQLDIEITFITQDDLMKFAVECALSIMQSAGIKKELLLPVVHMSHAQAELEYCNDKPDTRFIMKWEASDKPNYHRKITLDKAIISEWQNNPRVYIEGNVLYLKDISCGNEILQALNAPYINHQQFSLLIVYDFPMYEFNNGQMGLAHNPFTDLKSGIGAKAIAKQFDLVLNGLEIASGGVRCTCPKKFIKNMYIFHKSISKVHRAYNYFIETLLKGVPRHGGFAIGLDRLLMILLKTEHIRDVVAFPTSQSGKQPITMGPAHISNADLVKFGLQILPKIHSKGK
jgi:aspartyl-tRNA synthetase